MSEVMTMDVGLPFKPLLAELVSQVEGATGAVLLASDGEAVQWYAQDDGGRLRLRAAYAVVVLEACRSLVRNAGAGDVRHLTLQYQGASLVVQVVTGDYFVVLELVRLSNIAEALYRIRPIAETLATELA